MVTVTEHVRGNVTDVICNDVVALPAYILFHRFTFSVGG